MDVSILEGALSRYCPFVVALTTDTKESVDFGGVLPQLMKSVPWAGATVVDKTDVCQWFVSSVTDPAFAGTVAEVKAQLPPPGQEVLGGIDPNLVALCIKHRIMAIGYEREVKRLAAIEREALERRDLIDQLMEDGMTEAAAVAEADRELAAEDDDDEVVEPPPDVVILKHFPQTATDFALLDKVGVNVTITVVLNSQARFGRKDEINVDPKDKAQRRRLDTKKPDVRKGKVGREDQDRQDPLAVQVARELAKCGYMDRNVLRESAFFTYDVQCVDAGSQDDGSKMFRAKESETAVADLLNRELTMMLESAMRYRIWLNNKTFLKIPKLNIRRVVADHLKPTAPLPTSSKTTKKGKGKVEVDLPREEAPAMPLLPDMPPTCAQLPINNKVFRKVVSDLVASTPVDATVLLQACVRQVAAFRAGQDALMVDGDRVRDDVEQRGADVHAARLDAALLAQLFTNPIDTPSSDKGCTAVDSYTKWKSVLCKNIIQTLLVRGEGCSMKPGGSTGIMCGAEEANSKVLLAAQRGELHGASFAAEGDAESRRLAIATSELDRRSRYHLISTAFEGRVPFPVYFAWEQQRDAEYDHYHPLPNDDEEVVEEEEEEEEELDEDGVPIPRPPKSYPIEYKNLSEERARLIRRRAVYELLSQKLHPSSLEALEACGHLLATVSHETTTLFPSDGSTICAHRSMTTADTSSGVVFNESGDTAFGFHCHRGLSYRLPELISKGDTSDPKVITSGVRGFFSDVRSQLRMVVEASILDPSPPRTVQSKRPDASLQDTLGGKRNNNTPRQKALSPLTQTSEEPAVSQEKTSPRPSQTISPRPPKLHVSISVPSGFECVAHPDCLFIGSGPEPFDAAVYWGGEVVTFRDKVREWVLFVNGTVRVIGEHISLTVFPNGDLCSTCAGSWLYTASNGSRRAYSPHEGATEFPPVTQATQTSTLGTTTVRDDFVVCERTSTGIQRTTVSSLIRLEPQQEGVLRVTCGTTHQFNLVVDANGLTVHYVGLVALSLQQSHLLVLCPAGRSCTLEWSSGFMFVQPNPSPMYYAVDCFRGGLRTRDDSNAFIVSPFGRTWQGTLTAEDVPTPRDLTTKHVLDRFCDLPEVISPLFEAAVRLADTCPMENSLYFQRRLPPQPPTASVPQSVAAKPEVPSISLYKSEYNRDAQKRIEAVMSTAEAASSRGCTVFEFNKGDQCLVLPVAEEFSILKQLLLSRVPSDVYCHVAEGSTVFIRANEEPIVLAGKGCNISSETLVANAQQAIPTSTTLLTANRDAFVCPIHPVCGGGPVVHVQKGNWTSPVEELHASLSQVQSLKHNYWYSSGAAAIVDPCPTSLLKKPPPAATKVALSPSSPVKVAPPKGEILEAALTSFANPTPPALPSQAQSKKMRGNGVLRATPSELPIGNTSVGYQYKTAFALTNLTTRSCRFRIASNVPSVSVKYEQVPLAAGMTTTVVVVINCVALGETHTKIKVSFEGGVVEVPCYFSGLECTNSIVEVPGTAQLVGLVRT